MRAKEFIAELMTPPKPAGTVGQTLAPNPDDKEQIGKLSSLVTNLQKQVQDLQKSAVQTSSQITAQKDQLAKTASPQPMKPGIDKDQQMGQAPQTGASVSTQPSSSQTIKSTPSSMTPGVNQSSQITNMKIKQQLAKNQGMGT